MQSRRGSTRKDYLGNMNTKYLLRRKAAYCGSEIMQRYCIKVILQWMGTANGKSKGRNRRQTNNNKPKKKTKEKNNKSRDKKTQPMARTARHNFNVLNRI